MEIERERERESEGRGSPYLSLMVLKEERKKCIIQGEHE